MPNFNILILWRLDQHKLLSERTGGPDIFAQFPKCKAKREPGAETWHLKDGFN